MHSTYVFVSLLIFFSVGQLSYGNLDGDMAAECSHLIRAHNYSRENEPIFPILTPLDLTLDCMNLKRYKKCVHTKIPEDMQMFVALHFMYINFLERICHDFRGEYLRKGPCIQKYKKSPKLNDCKSLNSTGLSVCDYTYAKIDCIGKGSVDDCGSEASNMVISVMRSMIETVWEIVGQQCWIDKKSPVPFGASREVRQLTAGQDQNRMSMLLVLPCALLLLFGTL